MGTHFYNQIDALFRQSSDASTKLYSLSRMTTPVFTVKNLVLRHNTARYITHQSHGRRRSHNIPLIRLFQCIQRGLHQSTVESLISGQRSDGNLFSLETLRYRPNCRAGTANDLMNAVVNRDTQVHAVG